MQNLGRALAAASSAAAFMLCASVAPASASSPHTAVRYVTMTSESQGWIVTSTGVYHTSNGGENWINCWRAPLHTTIGSAMYFQANRGWVAVTTSDGRNLIAYGANTGAAWALSTTLPTVVGLSFANTEDGRALTNAQGLSGPQDLVSVYATHNGGRSWSPVAGKGLPLNGIKTGIVMSGAGGGYVSAIAYSGKSPVLWRTGGGPSLTWGSALTSLQAWGGRVSITAAALPEVFADGTIATVLGARTSEGASEWRTAVWLPQKKAWALGKKTPVSASAAWDLQLPFSFLNANDVWVIAGDDLLRSTNGGQQWSVVRADPELYGATELQMVSRDVGWAVTSSGSLLETRDGGAKWSRE